MKKIVTDDYEFANLIRGGAVYVDKTDLLARLASGRDGTQFFLARPRRFGKSLMQIEEKSFTALVRVAERQIAAGDVEGLIGETLYQLYAKLPPTWTPKTEQDAIRCGRTSRCRGGRGFRWRS